MIVAVLVVATVPPVTTPVVNPTVAIPVALLLQVPPPASLNVVVKPEHTVSVPNIADGNGLTVTTAVIIHPVGSVYVIVAVLAVATVPPVTIPVVKPTVAIPVALLLQVPPPASLNVVVKPEHTLRLPNMVVGNGFTVTTAVVKQPEPIVYVIVAVLLVATVPPVTIPVTVPILAIPDALLVHVPGVVASLNEVLNPEHTLRLPNIAVGDGFTVTTAVAIQPDDKV